MSENTQPQFAVQRIYVKDVSFEAPNSPQAFTKEWKPEVQIELNSSSQQVDAGLMEVSLKITVTATNEGETAFLVEVVQAGLFHFINIPEEHIRPMLGITCPNLLFPYVREAIDNLVIKGGFQALNLAPINFEAIYQQQVAQANSEAEAAPAQE